MKTLLNFVSARKKEARCVAVLSMCAALSACASRSQFQKGYDSGASDTVKRQYWILQDMQKRDRANPERRFSLYRLPIAPDPNATVKKVPYEITIPIYE